MSRTALVLGANGHLGAHLVRLLRSRGQPVRAFVRPTSDLRGLEGTDVEIVRGDVVDAGALAAAVVGCQDVYHLASPTDRQPGVARTIVDGTLNVLAACQQRDVERLLYTSSIVTVGYSSSPHLVLDERARQRTDATVYHSAKWLAEQEVITFAARERPATVIVNPATLVGPLDYRVTPSNAPIQQCLDGRLRFALPGGLTIVHVADAARGLLLAMEKGQRGMRYILGGERLTIRDYFAVIARECDRPEPMLTLPRPAVLAAGALLSIVERLSGRTMPFTFTQARLLAGRYGWYSSEKAARELDYQWRPAADAVRDYVHWVRQGRPAASHRSPA